MGCGSSKAASASRPMSSMVPHHQPIASPLYQAEQAKAAAAAASQPQTAHGAASSTEGGVKQPFASQYDLKEKLGRGQFAVVHRAINRKTGLECAVKCITKATLTPEDLAALTIEVKSMQMLNGHPNFVQYYDFFDEKENFFLVMEVITGGELFDRICEKAKYTEREARDLVHQLASAIAFAHSKGIAHRDLKPENILLKSRTDDTSIKLADLGFAKLFSTQSPLMTTPCGTPGYVAPEILSGKPYEAGVDIWSAGVIFYILLCGYPPFASENDDQKELFAQIREGRYEFDPREWGVVSEQAKDLIRNILVVDPRKRFTAEQILRHPWMQAEASAIPDVALGGAIEQLKRFNARRRLKRAMNAVRSVVRTKILLAAKQMKSEETGIPAENVKLIDRSGRSAEEAAAAANSKLAMAMLSAAKAAKAGGSSTGLGTASNASADPEEVRGAANA